MKIEYELGNKFTGFHWGKDDDVVVCLVERVSPYDGKTYWMEVLVTEEQYNKWKDGELIQQAMPHLTPDEREFILTGLTAEQFNELYAEDVDDIDEGEYLRENHRDINGE